MQNNWKKTSIYIYEGFSKDTMKLKKSLWEQVLGYQKKNTGLNA